MEEKLSHKYMSSLLSNASKHSSKHKTVEYKIYVSKTDTEERRYNDSVCYQRFCYKIEFAVI